MALFSFWIKGCETSAGTLTQDDDKLLQWLMRSAAVLSGVVVKTCVQTSLLCGILCSDRTKHSLVTKSKRSRVKKLYQGVMFAIEQTIIK